ncbi:MAG: hypothetical protein K0Q73_7742, partial [Paenibacillus sp.]|nr:hypothetical protein [Paenibacillus sp.]
IHQTIPLQGMANVVISVETSSMGEEIRQMINRLQAQEGVKRAMVIGQGS